MGSEQEVLLYYTEVRWLSREQVLKRLFELRTEVLRFLKDNFMNISRAKIFYKGLAYLADIFSHLNENNLSLQGPAVTIADASERLKGFLCKLLLWKRRTESDNFAIFPMLEELVTQGDGNMMKIISKIQSDMSKHLESLQTSFESYFSSEQLVKETWERSPFLIEIDERAFRKH